jgi:hypothetical protein
MDVHPAALAIENNAVLCTADDDFSRFPAFQILPLSAAEVNRRTRLSRSSISVPPQKPDQLKASVEGKEFRGGQALDTQPRQAIGVQLWDQLFPKSAQCH